MLEKQLMSEKQNEKKGKRDMDILIMVEFIVYTVSSRVADVELTTYENHLNRITRHP